MRVKLFFCLTILLYLNGNCQQGPVISERLLPLGAEAVTYHSIQNGNYRNALFINLHQNEFTSVEAAKAVLAGLSDYQMVELRFRNQRNLDFKLRGRDYSIDPNRMFTRTGIRLSLERDSTDIKGYVVRKVNRHANSLKRFYINKSRMVIALHNNTEDNYSVLGYAPGGADAPDVANLHINSTSDPDDFFYTTDPNFFNFAKSLNFNVVLQKEGPVKDDGSLSVYCGKKNIPYINIEAQHGHLEEQKKMVSVVIEYLQKNLNRD